ncbi:MAG: cytochrome c [Halieaceae bacterium]|jgi:cytochrome c5|nr:cytochrome c [Halieaceae bacterium]
MNKPSMTIAALCLLATAGTASAEADNTDAGRQVYEATCSRCHDSGKMGAPVLEDPSEWTDHSAVVWSDVHAQHLDDGYVRDAAEDAKKGITAAQMEAATNYIVSIIGKK